MGKKLKEIREAYKAKIFELLKNRISIEKHNRIKDAQTKNEINLVLRTFSIAMQEYLAKNGISSLDYILPRKFVKRKKHKQFKERPITTNNSIKPIYTPMGNKK